MLSDHDNNDSSPRSERLTDEEVAENQADRERQGVTRQDVLLHAIGAKRVRVETLPAGPGVLPSEVGKPGPYFGIEFANGERHGWWLDDVAVSLPPEAMNLAKDRLAEIAIGLLSEESSVDREQSRELELEAARRVANACTHSDTPFLLACHECIAAYAQQLRADRRLMRKALEREQAENARLREALAKIEAWTHEFGAALKPPGADSYGDGVRDAKSQIAAILSRGAK